MNRGRQKVSFEGLLQENVLGTFTVIRSFVDLRDLANVFVPIPCEGSGMLFMRPSLSLPTRGLRKQGAR